MPGGVHGVDVVIQPVKEDGSSLVASKAFSFPFSSALLVF